MSNCKTCLKKNVCKYNDGVNLYCNSDFSCPHYIDCAKFVELPRNLVKNKVWIIKNKKIKKIKVKEVAVLTDIYGKLSAILNKKIYADEMFSTKEEAETALKKLNVEREKNA